jgi:TPR repeat protein
LIHAVRFHDDKGVVMNLGTAAHYYKLAADHQDSEIQQLSKLCLLPTEPANHFTIEATQLKSPAVLSGGRHRQRKRSDSCCELL